MPAKVALEDKKWPLVADEWSHRHDLVVMLKATGSTNNEIAAELGYDPAYVSRILADPRGLARFEEFRKRVLDGMEDAAEILQTYAAGAAKRAVVLMQQDEDKQVAIRSAFGILDRAGYAKVERHFHAHANLTKEQTDQLVEAGKVAREVNSEFTYEVVDAELVDDEPSD